MKSTKKELEVMRAPSASETSKKLEDAQNLQLQVDAWKAMIEFRIHLEGGLTLAHRLPEADAAQAFSNSDNSTKQLREKVAENLSGLLGEVTSLQGQMNRSLETKSVEIDASSLNAAGE